MTVARDILGEDDAAIGNADPAAVRYFDLGFTAHVDDELPARSIVVAEVEISARVAKENAASALQGRDTRAAGGLKGNFDQIDP